MSVNKLKIREVVGFLYRKNRDNSCSGDLVIDTRFQPTEVAVLSNSRRIPGLKVVCVVSFPP